MAKSFLRKIPCNQLRECSGTSTSPILFFCSLTCVCVSPCVWWGFSLVHLQVSLPHVKELIMMLLPPESTLESFSSITPRSVRERTLIGIRGLEDLEF